MLALSTHRAVMALLDIPVNGATAILVAAPLILWPLRPRFLLLALACGVLLDVDHAVAARSLALADLLSLPVRPWTHCLAFALFASAAAGIILRSRTAAWVALAALVAHLLRDTALGGARLFFPAEGVQKIPYASYIAGLFGLLAISAAVRAVAQRRRLRPLPVRRR